MLLCGAAASDLSFHQPKRGLVCWAVVVARSAATAAPRVRTRIRARRNGMASLRSVGLNGLFFVICRVGQLAAGGGARHGMSLRGCARPAVGEFGPVSASWR